MTTHLHTRADEPSTKPAGPDSRRSFVVRTVIGLGGLMLGTGLRLDARQPGGHLIVLMPPAGPAAIATEASAGFTMGLDEVARAASLLGSSIEGIEIADTAAGVAQLRGIVKSRRPVAFVTAASSPRARQVATLIRDQGGLVFSGRERLVDDALSWMPPDADVVDLVADWANEHKRRAWHIVTTDTERDRPLAALVRRAASERGAAIVATTPAKAAGAGQARYVIPPAHAKADIVIVASAAAEFEIAGGAADRPGVPVALCAIHAIADVTGARSVMHPEIWHGSLRRFGATQLNMRFVERFDRPMTSTAWGHWLAVKAAWEATARSPDAGGSGSAMTRVDALARIAIDGQKGIGFRFKPGAPLSQTLYLVERGIDAKGETTDVVVVGRLTPADVDRPARYAGMWTG